MAGDFGTILTTNDGGSVFIEKMLTPKATFSVYPNPANNKITITDNRMLQEDIIISIYSITGEQIMHQQFENQSKIELDVITLEKGMYLVKIQSKTGIETKKVIIH